MADLWPWLAVAGFGAIHGLSPANGWMFVAACGLRAADSIPVPRALLPIAFGHTASVALVACAFAQGLSMDRMRVQTLAGALLVGLASYRLLRRPAIGAQAGQIGIALWSFLMSTAHGAGLMLVPALVPMCLAGNPARAIFASGSPLLALAAVGLHMAAMLATTGLIATGVCRGIALRPRLLNGRLLSQAWTAALALAGVLLMALR